MEVDRTSCLIFGSHDHPISGRTAIHGTLFLFSQGMCDLLVLLSVKCLVTDWSHSEWDGMGWLLISELGSLHGTLSETSTGIDSTPGRTTNI